MYRFRKEYEDAIIDIPSLRLKITRFNLDDEKAQMILKKFPKFAHNIEFVGEGEEGLLGEDQEEVETFTSTGEDLNQPRTEFAKGTDPDSIELNPPVTDVLPDVSKIKRQKNTAIGKASSNKAKAKAKKSGK